MLGGRNFRILGPVQCKLNHPTEKVNNSSIEADSCDLLQCIVDSIADTETVHINFIVQ